MTHKLIRFVVSIGFVFAVTTAGYAQNASGQPTARDSYLISAKAGGVNLIEGNVGVVRVNKTSGRLLKGDEVAIGDRVSTDSNGKAEILLNPGSFVRVGGNTAFEFRSTSLDDLEIAIDRGSAMFEVYATREFKVTIITPKGNAVLVESGIYRIDISENGIAKLAVWDGLAEINVRGGVAVKKGRVATIDKKVSIVEKFDRNDKDELAVWSKDRGKLVARNTARLKNQQVRNSLISAYNGGRWGMYDAFGLWVYDASFGGSCFLPFGRGWFSPYGYGFGHNVWWYNLPTVIYYPPYIPAVSSPYGTFGKKPGSREALAGGGGNDGAPPFVRIEENSRQSNPIRVPNDQTFDRTPASAPVYSPPVSAPVSVPSSGGDTGSKTRP